MLFRCSFFFVLSSVVVSLLLLLPTATLAVPNGFVDEGITDQLAITGAFAANPRNDGKPMLLLSSKEGLIMVLEDPDENPEDMIVIANLEDLMCANGERGLQTIRPHPDFATNRYLYTYYTLSKKGCLEDATDGPRNRLARFTIDADTLLLDMDSAVTILETSPTPNRVHNGGSIQWGVDGKMWVSIGDGGSRKPPVSQDPGSLYGSILRLNDDGSIPPDNPFDGVRCGNTGGLAPEGKVCGEIYATGLRNPFRLVMDPNTVDKVKFHVGDVGASAWEEISVGGTDYPGVNYGWPPMEGPCKKGNNQVCTTDQVEGDYQDPFYYYEHTKSSAGGAVTGSAFVPDDLGWPRPYGYMFIDFVFHKIYNLIRDDENECRECIPPVPGYRNVTFHSHPYMVDMFFGPYKNTQALYYIARSDGQNVRRIRYTASDNRAPTASVSVDDVTVAVGDVTIFDGSGSTDEDGDDLGFFWDFGDGSSSTDEKAEHSYSEKGEYTVTLTVTDSRGQRNQEYVEMQVGVRPEAVMASPQDGDEFFVGQRLRLEGSAVDSSGIQLEDTQLFWEVRQHHADHYHPFLDRTEGNNIDLFSAPEPEDFNAATNSHLEVIMYAVDKDGLTTTISRRVNPKIVMVDIRSNHDGLDVLLDEFPVTTPATITSWENHELRLDVVDQWPFLFTEWSDGGARSHVMLIPPVSEDGASNPTIEAKFVEVVVPGNLFSFVPIIQQCNTTAKCARCEGHCHTDDDCLGSLVCFQKGGFGLPVPGCEGIDNSNTDWCTLMPATDAPVTTSSVSSSPVTPGPTAAPLPTTAPVMAPVGLPASPAPVAKATDAPTPQPGSPPPTFRPPTPPVAPIAPLVAVSPVAPLTPFPAPVTPTAQPTEPFLPLREAGVVDDSGVAGTNTLTAVGIAATTTTLLVTLFC